jgi:hypothetical protein
VFTDVSEIIFIPLSISGSVRLFCIPLPSWSGEIIFIPLSISGLVRLFCIPLPSWSGEIIFIPLSISGLCVMAAHSWRIFIPPPSPGGASP